MKIFMFQNIPSICVSQILIKFIENNFLKIDQKEKKEIKKINISPQESRFTILHIS
jgi:hypothetical protein